MNSTEPQTNFIQIRGETIKVNEYKIAEPKALVVITHGILEHSGRYAYVATELNRRGLNVVTYDLRGHGQSSGSRAYVDQFQTFVDDLNSVVEWATRNDTSLPIVMLGHSMGGLITYLHALQAHNSQTQNIVGYVLMSPALSQPPLSLSQKIQVFVAQTLRRWLSPYDLRDISLKSTELMTDPELQRQHQNDPLIMTSATTNLSLELIAASSAVSRAQIAPPYPMLMLQGSADTVVNAQTNVENCKAILTKSQHVVMYEVIDGEKHELFNSIIDTRTRILNRIDQFIKNAL